MFPRKYFTVEDFKQSYSYMQELRQRIPNVNVSFYVDSKIIEAVHRALDIPLVRANPARGAAADEVDEVM